MSDEYSAPAVPLRKFQNQVAEAGAATGSYHLETERMGYWAFGLSFSLGHIHHAASDFRFLK
jgi:hypothetical protein